jgi:hypothetical protein
MAGTVGRRSVMPMSVLSRGRLKQRSGDEALTQGDLPYRFKASRMEMLKAPF